MKGEDEGFAGQHRAHDFALHADAAPMNDAQGFQTQPVRFIEVGFDDGFNLFRVHSVKVKDIGNRDSDWLIVERHGTFNSILSTLA